MSIIYYDFEDFRLDVENEKLLKDNQPILLTQKAFMILHLLVKNAGQLVKKESLISEIWQNSFVEDSNITQQIYILRKVLGNDKKGKPLIETLPKRGYCFVGEIKKIGETEISSIEESSTSQTSDLETKKGISAPSTQANFFQYGLVILAIFAVLGTILFFQFRKTPSETANIKSIAVLPFKKIGAENDDSKIGFGLADAIINNLSKQQKIPVRSMSAVFQYADKPSFDPIDAGNRLGVDSVLEGTVQRDGEQVRIALRLLKISDGSTIWAETFNEKFNHIFELQDSISAKVANSLSMNLSGWETQLVTPKPANSEAYQFYQLGVYFANTRTKDGLERAVSYFQKVIELDTKYAPAYAMLADSYNWLHQSGSDHNREDLLNKSEESAKKALTLDNSLAEAHIAFSYVQFVKYKDYESAKNSLERAVQLAPFNPTARLHYGWEILQRGDLESAYQQISLAQEYAPLSAHNNLTLCSLLMYKKDFTQALKFCQKSAELQPTTPFVNVQIANILFLNGKTDEAISLLKVESKNEAQKFDALGSLAYIYAKTGQKEKAGEIYRQLSESPETFNKYSDLTLTGFALGKKEEALKSFKQLLSISSITPSFLQFDPFYEEVFKDNDFKQLLPIKSK